jgi:hypothetical protein
MAGGVAVAGGLVAPAAEATAPGITVGLVTPQQVGLDPATVAVRVGWRVAGCPSGCDLYRVRTLRDNDDEQQIDSRSFPTGTVHSFSVTDSVRSDPGLGWDTSYEVRRYTDASRTSYDLLYDAEATPSFASEDAFHFGAGWSRDLQLASTETMTMRSSTPGSSATLPAVAERREIGVVSAKGPRNGVMRISLGGTVLRTIDLTASSWTPRQVVAAVALPAGAFLTVANGTPAGRAASDVDVDGLVTLPVSPGAVAAGPTFRRAPLAAAARGAVGSRAAQATESVGARVLHPQQLPAGGGALLVVTANVFGCPSGCSIIKRVAGAAGPVDTVLLMRTTPASTSLQPLTATDHPSNGAVVAYLLTKGGWEAASTPDLSPTAEPDTVATYSHGWSRYANAGSTGGRTMRSSTPGTGATYRVAGAFEGRDVGVVSALGPHAGVLAVYVDGALVQQVDLHAATWQPRQVVASVDLPLAGRLTVANVTAASRTARDVYLDGLVLLDHPNDFY